MTSRARWSLVVLLAISAGCSSKSEAPPVDAGPPEHRIVGTRCAPTADSSDAGALSCTTDADCLADGGFTAARFCLGGICRPDQCLIDQDCPTGSACGCSDQQRGLAFRMNSCLPSTCRTDDDCAETGFCSPSVGGRCGSLSGFHCRTKTDTCHSNSDCAGRPTSGSVIGYTCNYAPEVGHWQCVGIQGCNG